MSLRLITLSDGWTVVLDCVVWAVVGVGAGYGAYRMRHAFADDGWLTRLRPFEQDGRVYERRVRIKRWKARLPEAGDLFGEGFDKKHLHGGDPAYLGRFLVETRRAEVTHWVVLAAAPFFVLWNPWGLFLVMLAYGLVANVPCILVQRYNRARLLRIRRRAVGILDGKEQGGYP